MREQGAFVFIELDGVPVPAGYLLIVDDGRLSRAEFSYGRRYLERPDALAIDPVMLPLTDKVLKTKEDFMLFNGIRDAAPDAWGRKLIDKYMLQTYARPADEIEFLLSSQGESRIGALQFGPTTEKPSSVLDVTLPNIFSNPVSLESFQDMVDRLVRGEDVPETIIDHVAPGSDLGGARPKGTIEIDSFPWLAKFNIKSDRINMAGAEAGCLDLCEKAGLDTCQRKIEQVNGRDVLLLKRFDRVQGENGNLKRIHMISGLSLLGAHEMDFEVSGYADLYDATRRYSGHPDPGPEIYKRMVMNVLCGNTDDHYRNHAFLLDGNNKYTPSPVYDVTPSLQRSSNRSMFFHLGKAGSGRDANLENAIAAAPSMGIRLEQAVSIINECSAMVAANWKDIMSARGLSRDDISLISGSFSEAGKIFDPVTGNLVKISDSLDS